MTLRLLFLVLLVLPANNQSNCWQGIKPLHSTCEDVKGILNVDKCSFPISNYTLSEFRVMVEFQKETCQSEPRAWNVPKGTVIAVTLSPRRVMRPSDFGLDISRYEKREDGEIVGLVHYESKEEGVTIDLYQGLVQNLFLYPSQSDEGLRCKLIPSQKR